MGGNAIKSVSVSSIKKDNVDFTLREIENEILKPLGLSEISIKERIGGSLLYKEISGVIDIFIEQGEIKDSKTFYENLKEVCNSLGIKEVNKIGLTISTYFPQYNSKGEITDLFVQVDFIIVPSIKFSSSFKIDFQKTKYKNAHMQLLLNSILKYLTLKKIDEDIVQYYGIHPFRGILLKTKQKNSKTGKYKEIDKKEYSYNLNDVISLINQKGYNLTIEDLSSFETLYDWMKNNIKDSKIINKIKEEISDAFKNTNLIMPEELNENMKPEKTKFNAIVAVGRFQPFHKGHLENIKRVVSKYPNLPLYILNIHNKNNPKTVFSSEITKELIEISLEKNLPSTVFFIIQKSLLPDAVDEMIKQYDIKFPVVWVFGNKRKETNNKNSFFHIEGSIVEGSNERIGEISGTKVRKAIYNNDFDSFSKMMCEGVNDKKIFKKLREELNNKINEVIFIFKEFYGNVDFLKEDIVDVILQIKGEKGEEKESVGQVEFIEDENKDKFKKAIKYVTKQFNKEEQEKLNKLKEEFEETLTKRNFSKNEIDIFWHFLEHKGKKENSSISELPLYKFILEGKKEINFDNFIKTEKGNLKDLLPKEVKEDVITLSNWITTRGGKTIGKGELLLILLFKGNVPKKGDVEIGEKKIEIKGEGARLKEQKNTFNLDEGKKILMGEEGLIAKILKEKKEVYLDNNNKISINEEDKINITEVDYFALNKENKFGIIVKGSITRKEDKKEELININSPLILKNNLFSLSNKNIGLFKDFLKAYYKVDEDLKNLKENSYFNLALSYYFVNYLNSYKIDYFLFLNNNFDYVILSKGDVFENLDLFKISPFYFFASDTQSLGSPQITLTFSENKEKPSI